MKTNPRADLHNCLKQSSAADVNSMMPEWRLRISGKVLFAGMANVLEMKPSMSSEGNQEDSPHACNRHGRHHWSS